MAIPTITALPTPPSRSDPANFATRGDDFMAALPTLRSEINAATAAIPTEVTTVATDISTSVSTGIISTQSFTGGLVAATSSEVQRLAPCRFDDFIQGGNAEFACLALSSGSYTGGITSTSDMAQHPGILLLTSSTTVNSGVLIRASSGTPLSIYRIVGSEVFEVVFKTPPVFTTITGRFGFHDAISITAPVDGLFFELSSTGTVVAKNTSNSTTTTSSTITTLSTSTWYTFRIDVNSDATSVDYRVYSDNGTQLGSTVTQTSNIPTAIGRECEPSFIVTSNGASAISLGHIDYIYFGYSVTRTRGPTNASIKLRDFGISVNTASPNATIPVHAISAASATDQGIDIAIVPKNNAGATSNGSLLAAIPDNTATGGNKRGQYAVDWQRNRNAASQVASGNYSVIAGGRLNTASGEASFSSGYNCNASNLGSIAIGYTNTASGQYAVAIGGSNTVSANNSAAFASNNTVSHENCIGLGSWISRQSLSIGKSFYSKLLGTFQTSTNNTPTVLSVVMADSESSVMSISVRARVNTSGDTKSFSGKVLVKRASGVATVSVVGSPTISSDFGDSSLAACTVTVQANTTSGDLDIKVTGLAATTIDWYIMVDKI